jgi:hypothetical protein
LAKISEIFWNKFIQTDDITPIIVGISANLYDKLNECSVIHYWRIYRDLKIMENKAAKFLKNSEFF